MDDRLASPRARRLGVGLALLVWALFALRAFLASGLPLFFDAHSHLTRSWLAARALEAWSWPSWSFAWYGGYRLFEFYSPGWYLLTGGLGSLLGDVALATKLALIAGQLLSVLAFYAFLLRLGLAPLPAAFGALLHLYDAERWRVIAVIGNYPSLFLYALTPLLLLALVEAGSAPRSGVRLFSKGALLLAAMAFGHLTNVAQMLPALLAFAAVWLCTELERPAALRALALLAASVPTLGALSAGLAVPMLLGLPLVSLRLDAGGPAWDPEPALIALGWVPGSMQRIFVTSPGAFWCALALATGLLSLRARHARWRACFAGLCTCLLSLAVLGERAALALVFFVAPLCAAAVQIAAARAREHGAAAVARVLPLLAVAAVPVWHASRNVTPLRYVDAASLAVYQRIPRSGGLGRTFDVTPATDSVDGVYGRSSFAPHWTGRAVPFGAFPQGAPLAVNLQLALVGKLVTELAAPEPVLSRDALDLLRLLHVEWLVDREEPSRLGRLALDAAAAELREPGLIRLHGASPALFAPHVELLPEASAGGRIAEPAALLAQLEAQWAREPYEKRGERSLDALSRTGTRRDWPVVLPWLRAMRIAPQQPRAERFFVARPLAGATAPAPAAGFAVLSHEEALRSVTIVARADAPGFVRLAYAFDPDATLALDGRPAPAAPDFLGAVVLAFPAGTHAVGIEAPRATLRIGLLLASGGLATALAMLWVWSRRPGAHPLTRSEPS